MTVLAVAQRATLAFVATLAPLAAQQDLERWYAEAQELRQRGADAAEVRAAYARVADGFAALPRGAPHWFGWLPAAGFSAYHAGAFARASEWLALAIEQRGPDAFLVEYQLRSFVASGAFTAALAAAREHDAAFGAAVDAAFGADVDAAGELRDAAAAAMRAGETEVGMWFFEREVARSGGAIWALGNLALSQRSLGREAECQATYEQALAKAPDDVTLWNDYGLFLKGIGRVDEAIDAFRKSLSLERAPFDGPAIGNLVTMQLDGIDVGIADPAQEVARVVASIPTADLARRRCIDAILAERAPARDRPPRTK